jgi:polyhydroxyalkanoate synthesis regulator phasin
MLLDDVLKNPVLKKALAAGEEQAGRVVGKLLSSEAVVSGLQGLLSAASTARATLEAGVQSALKAAHVPAAGEVEALREKVQALEAQLGDLSARLDASASAGPARGRGQVDAEAGDDEPT